MVAPVPLSARPTCWRCSGSVPIVIRPRMRMHRPPRA